jgi:trigger factor
MSAGGGQAAIGGGRMPAIGVGRVSAAGGGQASAARYRGAHTMPTDTATPLTTTLTELPDSRVRLEVHVAPAEVESRIEHKARQLGRELKLPGFRRGKVPAPLVLQRVGRETVLEEAVRDTIGDWYAKAIASSGIVPVGDPQLDLGELPPRGQELRFSIEIGVLPVATLGEYRGLEVGRGEPQVDEQLVEQEIERLRDRLAKLETVQRAAEQGDFVVIDYLGSLVAEGDALQPLPGGEGRDQLVELGSHSLVPGFEEGLIGAQAGEQRTVALTFPADYGQAELAGRPASFQIAVKEVKRKELPALDDDLAIDAGFDTLGELREDVRGRVREAHEQRLQGEFRQAALDAAVANASVQTPPALVQARAQEMWERLLHSLSHRGITRERYLQIDGRSEEDILAELLPDAEQALRREAVLTAVVDAEGIAPSEQELLKAVAPTAERESLTPVAVLQQLRDAGRVEELREEVAVRQAIDLIAEQARPIPLEQAQAREKLWTPEKAAEQAAAQQGEVAGGEPAAPARLWTPLEGGPS